MASKNQDDQFFNALRRKLNGDDEEKKTKETNDERFFTALRQKLPASGTPVKAEAPAPQPTAKRDTSTQTGRLRPGWSVEDVVEATEPKSSYQKALDKIDQAKDKAEAARRFGNMSTEDLLSYVPSSAQDKRLYETYMGSRLEAAKSLERQSKQAKNDAAKTGNEAEAYREFLGMPGASDEEIFGLAQAVRENNAQAKSLEPQKWLEYAEGLQESQQKKQSLTETGNRLQNRAEAANEQGQAWEYSNVIKSYGELINSPDFAKKSQYNPAENSLTYKAINGDREAQDSILSLNSRNTGFTDVSRDSLLGYNGGKGDYLFQLTDTEKSIYNALYASSPEAADNFVAKLKPYLESRARNSFQNYVSAMAQRYPVLASAATIPAGAMQSGEYLTQLADIISDGKVNQNSADYRASQMSNTVRGEVSKMAEAKWGELGSAAYNLGMSMGDFLFSTAAGGGTKALSLGLMGTRAAANTVLNLKDRGLDDTAAFTLGSIAGAAEIVTESFSLEKLLNPNLVADGIAKNILKNILAEASEEGASDLINWAAEYIYDAITGNNEAEWKQQVYDAIQNGADPNDAVLAAIQDNLVQLGMDMLSGGVSGGLMSAAGTPFYLNNFNASEQGQYANAIRGNEEGLQALIQSGLESPQNTESRQRAEKAEYQVAKGKTPSTLTIARLVEANQQQINNETAEQSGQGRLRLTLPRTTPQNAPTPEQVEALRQIGAPLPAGVTTAQEAPPVPQETRSTPGLTLPARTTQSTERAAETPRLTLPTAEQISAFGDEQNTAERAAQTESELVTRLRASKPGLLMDDYASGIDENERRAIDETAKRLGLRVGFSDTVSVGQDNAKIYDDGVVLIEKNNPNPIGFLYGHEMGHWLQQNSPEAYNEFAEAARTTDPEWFKTREEATTAAYREAGIEISPERIQEEVLSDYAGWLVQDEDVLNRFINQNKDKPNVLRRLYEAIKALAAKLTGREKQQATTAADLLLRAMNATEANVQKDVTQAGETRSLLKSPNDNVYNGDTGGEDNGELYEGTGSGSVQNGWTTGGNDRGSMARSPQNQSRGSGESWDTLSQPKQRAIGDTAERYLNSLDSDTQSILGRTGDPYTIVKTIWERYQENPASADLWVGFLPDVYDLLNEVSDIVSSPEGNETISNTADSDGNELSAGQTSYFADSKIRDKQGRLLVLYHGTTAVFTTFDLSRSGQNYNGWSEFGEGIYLTPNAKLAQFYADEAGRGRRTRVVPYYVNLTNPFSTMDAVPFAIDDLAEKYNLTEADQRSLLGAGYRLLDFLNEHHESVRDYLVAHEYDGVWDSYNGSKPNQVVAYYQNQIKDISNVNPTDDPDTMRSLKGLDADTAPESIQRNDEDYTAALDDGDIAKATQLVHETADSSMPDSKVRNASTGELRYVYHYTNKNFYEFRPMGQSAGSNRTLGDGYYVSTSETEFKSFGKNKMTLFANITNPFEMELTEEQAQAVYDKYFRPYYEDRFHTYEPHVVGKLQSYSQVFDYLKEAAEKNGTTTSAILSELGFDGVHSGPEWVAFYPEQLKSADVATYNNDGQLIPLSERFNPEEKDTRYSLKGLNADIAPESIQKQRNADTGKSSKGETGKSRKVMRIRTNTFDAWNLYNQAEAQMPESQPENFKYDVVDEKKSMETAKSRLDKDFAGEVDKLSAQGSWDGTDFDAGMGILYNYRQLGRATGDYSLFHEWEKIVSKHSHDSATALQAHAKYARTATEVARKAAEDLRKQHELNPTEQKKVNRYVNDVKQAVDDFADDAARGAVEDARGGKKGLKLPSTKQQYGDTQKAKDAMNVVKEIYDIFSRKTRRDHGAPVEEWTKLTGDQLASRIASRFNSGNKQRTTMQTILDDLLTYASEHALPKREGKTPRTATERITDYLNNREAYGEAWSEAKQVLREMYADDQEKLDALEAFLNSTISYNGSDLDQTMFRAILESADALGLTKDDILKLTAAGVNEGTIDRITDEFLRRIGSDDTNLRDTVARHITNLAMVDNQEGRLGRMENEAAKELDLKLQNLLRESKQTKSSAANAIAQYLINDLGISGTDAAIAADHIASHYMERIEQKAAQTLEKMFADKGERVKPAKRDKLMDLIHLGGLTNANVEDAVVDALGLNKVSRAQQRQVMDAMARFADTLDALENDDIDGLRQLIRDMAAQRKTKPSRLTEKFLNKETDAQYLRDFAMAQLDAIAQDYAPRNLGEKISTYQTLSHLLQLRTAGRNLGSNQGFDLVATAANNASILPDYLMGLWAGKHGEGYQRSVGFQKSWASQAKRQGAIKGAGRNAMEVNLNVDPRGRNTSKYGTGGRRTFSMANSGTVGKLMSHLEAALGYELNTTDEFHKGSVMGETLESLARFVDAGYMTQEQAEAMAEKEALFRSFQDDTLIGDWLGTLKDMANTIGFGDSGRRTNRGKVIHSFGLGDLRVKYTQVPGALLTRTIEFSPLGLAKAISLTSKFEKAAKRGEVSIDLQRDAALAWGRLATGSALLAGLYVLAKATILKRGDDEEDPNASALRTSQGFSGTQINIDALERWIAGEDPTEQEGDYLQNINFLEPVDGLMAIATMLANDEKTDKEFGDLAKDVLVKNLDGIINSASGLTPIQTFGTVFNVLRYYNKDEDELPWYFQIPVELAADSVTGFIPAPIRQLAQATDTVYRDQYRSKNIGLQLQDKVKNAIPGLRQTLAPKITSLGEEKSYEEPWLNVLNAMFLPGNASVYHTDDVKDELLRVYEATGKGTVLPERNAPYKISIGSESYTLTPDERTQYETVYGQAEAAFVHDLQTADWYKNADDASKADFLNSAKNIANDIAKVQWAAEREITYHDTEYRNYLKMLAEGTSYADVIKAANEKLADIVEGGIPRQVWDDAKADFRDIANSDISSYERGVQQRAMISDLDLTDDQKLLIYKNLADADSRIEQFRAIMDTGLDFRQTSEIYDQYSYYKSDDDSKASENAEDFALWVDKRQDLTDKQKEVIKEELVYWQQIAAKADRYESFTALGFAPDVASQMDNAISELQPLPGHQEVTTMQKTQAALGVLGNNASKADQMKILEKYYGGDLKNADGELLQWGQIKKVTDGGLSANDTLKLIEDGQLESYCTWVDSDQKNAGIRFDTYTDYKAFYSSAHTTYDETTGKAIKGQEKKDKVVEYIDSKDLSVEQKDSLYLMYYKESGLKDTPWHKRGGSGSGKTYARANLSRLELPRTNTTRQTGRLTLSRR